MPKVLASLKGAPYIPLLIIVVFVLCAILANLITTQDAYSVQLPNRLIPPFWIEGGTLNHPLGTDPLGRDILTRIIFGARISVIIALTALTIGGGFGTLVGLTAGFYGGKIDTLLMRFADITLAFPLILFAILLVMVLGPSMVNVIIAISLVLWARYARVIRGEVLGLMQRDFIARAKVSGASDWRIMMRHLLPNVMPTLIVLLTLQVGWVIIVEASLSFLGAGIPPPTPAWGSMLADGREYVSTAWWVTTAPGIAIMLVVLAFNLAGDWLRERLDPKQRGL
ncbi:MAG: ABC transporter permease [SAR202 cluster bacterium]|nr:ABC transporter permease [SAR202 cluster bacterium]